MELNFDSDPEDIRLSGDANDNETSGSRMSVSDLHLANRLCYSLRAYLSVLYLRIPNNFCIVLRGRVVEFHNIAKDLKYPEFVLYRPQTAGCREGSIITTIGFLKEAPLVNVHGFNVYHKNRLILPFWHVVRYSHSKGRGVVGVLEANFIQPTHSKQDFEKTPLFQKLEVRLKEMTWEYWDYHCGLIGYQAQKKPRGPTTPQASSESRQQDGTYQPVVLGASKRKEVDRPIEHENMRQRAGLVVNLTGGGPSQEIPTLNSRNQEAAHLIQVNKKLRVQCSVCEKREEELHAKVNKLRKELKEAQRAYRNLLVESRLFDKVEQEDVVVL